MKKLVMLLGIALAFGSTTMAADLALFDGSPNPGWYNEAQQNADVDTIIADVSGLFKTVERYNDNSLDAMATWLDENTDDGEMDIIWLNGTTPSVLYQFPNQDPDGSRAETWLDNGNMIINVGDWFGYMSYEGGTRSADNGGAGAANILDLAAGIIQGSASGSMDVTAEGSEFLPSLNVTTSERPIVLSQVQAPWEVAAIFAQNAAGTHADPIVLYNTDTAGYIAFINQAGTGNSIDDRGKTSSEFIMNWVATVVGLGDPAQARNPVPDDGVDDVLRDGILSWSPGQYPGTHNLYFGESFEDVNAATGAVASGMDANSFDPGRLEFGKTYYWRVDEVNTSPDKTVYKGEVWSFTVEPYAIPIPGDSIAVTASSQSNEFSAPENTVNGSGLDADGAHGIASETMWFTANLDLDPWIQFEFEGVKQLETMRVWNSNSPAEMAIGWGVKDVEIAYSADGENWTVLEGANQFSRGPSAPGYTAYDEVTFGGVAAKYVRFNIQSNWGGILMSYSLSEVQFDMIPAQARTPDPADGATGIVPNATVQWRAGREAGSHTIYVGADPNEVADGLAPSVTSGANSADLSSLNLAMGTQYYWRVDEVNDAEETPVWSGPVWSFTTVPAVVVDDFESYGNKSPDRPFQTWLDGFGYSADDNFPAGYGGNGTGAGIGHDIWSIGSPHYNGDIMETASTVNGTGQSMPLYYGNVGATASETQRNFAAPQDWTAGDAVMLAVPFRGTAGNTGSLYIKINGTKIPFDGPASSLSRPIWTVWAIDLTSAGINQSSVNELAIGVDGNGASGMILIDDILLHPAGYTPPVNLDITSPGDAVQGVPNDDDWPANESPANAIDDIVRLGGASSKYLHRKGGSEATGIQVTPMVGSTVVTELILTTANDVPARDPITFELYGSNASIDGPYSLIASGDVVDFAGATEWPRYSPNETPIEFNNSTAYLHYQIVFPTLRGASETLMQIAEIELVGEIQ